MKDNRLIDFTLVYNSHKKGLYNYLLKITRSTVLAEDILHNVFIKLYEHAALIKDPAKVQFWLFNTARNEAISHLRRSKKLTTLDDESLGSSAHEDLFALIETHEIRGVIMSELGKMDAAQSEVFTLKEYSGLSYKEVASIMNISEDLVKSRLFKVREKLKTAVTHLLTGAK